MMFLHTKVLVAVETELCCGLFDRWQFLTLLKLNPSCRDIQLLLVPPSSLASLAPNPLTHGLWNLILEQSALDTPCTAGIATDLSKRRGQAGCPITMEGEKKSRVLCFCFLVVTYSDVWGEQNNNGKNEGYMVTLRSQGEGEGLCVYLHKSLLISFFFFV